MNRDEVIALIRDTYSAEPEAPWQDENLVFRHDHNRKWFCVLLKVRRDRLQMSGSGEADVMNIKCDPLLTGTLRQKRGYRPAYHMNKEKWLSILLDPAETPEEEEIRMLLDMSWQMTAKAKK